MACNVKDEWSQTTPKQMQLDLKVPKIYQFILNVNYQIEQIKRIRKTVDTLK